MVKGEERKRIATLGMQALNHHSQAEAKTKNAAPGSIASHAALLWEESFGSSLLLWHTTPLNLTKIPLNRQSPARVTGSNCGM